MCRGAAGTAGTISRRMLLRGQFFPQLLRAQLEELPEAQLGEIQAQQAVRRLILAAAGPEATQVPVQPLQVQYYLGTKVSREVGGWSREAERRRGSWPS